MKSLILTFFSFLMLLNVPGQDLASLIKEGDRLEAIPNEKASFAKFKEVLKLQPTNIYALNKCSELCSRIGQRQTDKKVMDDYYAAAKTYAGIALKLNPNNADANCAMAIVLGRSSMSSGGKEKLNSAREIKKHVDVALKNDPKNFKAWHVLGRWNYELSNLNAFERTAVKLLYGGVPAASLQQAITAFEKAKTIAAGFILNYYEMSKAYKKNNQPDKAVASINTMLSLPNQTEDDPLIKEKGKRLLSQWR